MRTTYTVVYRIGTRAGWVWRRIFEAYSDYADALAKSREVERMGYETIIHDTAQLNAVGMPEG